MRRLFAWTAGVVGIAALARALARRRPHPAPPPQPATGVDGRAEALRRKLDETRAVGGAPDAVGEPAPLETTTDVDVHEGPSETIAERRARVHAKAQEAIAAMQEPLE
ncbi:MAG TPA: hypothetical protein VFM41_12155 [Gaiella sp.]|nr:hypothetical protein [Gaiella sp.]